MSFYQPIIGLEIHVELSTQAKMFCQCDANWQSFEPNTNTCPVCLGLPGALPVPNRKAVEYTIKIAQALGCTINRKSHFDRKHYFYPDLPKGYQISQYDEPIGIHGKVEFMVQSSQFKDKAYEKKTINIHRVHLEEDTGKLLHIGSESVVDFNRSGVPLVEIVTEPDFRSSEDVKAFLQELHTIITYLDVSEADMEKGSMRLEPNISVKLLEDGQKVDCKDLPPFKVEVKNINSFNFVKKSVDYEIKRQTELLQKGEIPTQETRGWDEDKQKTYSQRSKEDAHDYRYFPEPDVPPMEFAEDYITEIKSTIPELPSAKVTRYVKNFGIKEQDAVTLTRSHVLAQYFEKVVFLTKRAPNSTDIQAIANLIINKKISTDDKSPEDFVEKIAVMSRPKATDMGILTTVIQKIISANEKSVADYKSGKANALNALLGQVMREMKGQADPQKAKSTLEEALRS